MGGTVQCWGLGTSGQLGNGASASSVTPVTALGLTDAVQLDAGENHACVRRRDNSVVCWGYNFYGQVGNNTSGASANRNLPTSVAVIDNARWITAGSNYSCAARTTGAVVCWGYNNVGQVGDNTITSRAVPVSVLNVTDAVQVHAGVAVTCVRRASGAVQCIGFNGYGSMGDGSFTNRRLFDNRLPVFGLP
jgi:alpha-tubulin suppressor-like RCC1 family protein